MAESKPTRKSHCLACGKRLSERTNGGTVRWQSSHIDDKGLYCESCHPKNGGKSRKTSEKR